MSNTRVKKQDIRRQEQIRKKKSIRKRKLQRRRNVLIMFFLVSVVFIVINGLGNTDYKKTDKNMSGRAGNTKKSEISLSKNDGKKSEKEKTPAVVDSPKVRTLGEILLELEEMARDNEKIAEIYENYEAFPEDLLGLLVNNPETIDYVSGYLDRNQTVKDSNDESIQHEQFPLLLQWDLRWGYEKYGDSIMGLAGCGPTCLSMVVNSLTNDYNITPDVVARYSEKNGHYVNGTGTSWSLMTEGAKEYGVAVKDIVLDETVIKENLDDGKMVIAAVGSGDFTTKGHFIVIYGYGNDGFYVNDPNCIYRSSISWSYEKLSNQIKMLWAYWVNG